MSSGFISFFRKDGVESHMIKLAVFCVSSVAESASLHMAPNTEMSGMC